MADYVVVWSGTRDAQQAKAQQRPAPTLEETKAVRHRPVSPGGFGHSKAIAAQILDDMRDRSVKERQLKT